MVYLARARHGDGASAGLRGCGEPELRAGVLEEGLASGAVEAGGRPAEARELRGEGRGSHLHGRVSSGLLPSLSGRSFHGGQDGG